MQKPKWSDDPVVLDKVPTCLFKPTDEYVPVVAIPREEYIKKCGAYGVYGVDWYYTETGSLKYYDGKGWHYE